MATVEAGAVSTITALAKLDDVLPIGRSDDRGHAVLPDQCRVVTRGKLKARFIQDRDIRIKQSISQPNPFDLGRNPIPFLRFNYKVIHVLVLNDPFNGDVIGHNLGLFEVAVRFNFSNIRKSTNPKGAQV